MLGKAFSNTPVSKFIYFGLITTSITAGITDIKHLLYIEIIPHIYPWNQLWRLLTWQLAYSSSTTLLPGVITLYHLRLIERLWGTRKFASYLISIYVLTSLVAPLVLGTILRPLSLGTINYLPSGPTAIAFSLLAQYHATVPHVYRYRVETGISNLLSPSSVPSSGNSDNESAGLLFSDKSLTYLFAGHLALSQLPGSLLAAATGWVMGLAWRYEILLPGRLVEWRVPAWLVGEKSASLGSATAGSVEQLRRRLDERGVQGLSSGLEETNEARRRRDS